MEKFNHLSPTENTEDSCSHKMELVIDGEKVGEADVEYFSKPFPLYQISHMSVDYDKQGQGFGSKLMSYIENFLKKKGKAGILVDAVDPGSPAAGMYARRGWIEVPESHGLHVFNMPESANVNQLRGYAYRYADLKPGN